ncbi:MAG: DUF493 family protein [Acidobacteriota bacterium]|nr:DUF493 family protein [Acidobacteriota bacterium]
MSQPTAKEMIELPGPFSFKVFVKPDLMSRSHFLDFSRTHLGRDLGRHDLSERTSGKGTYICYTLNLHIEVYEEIEALYSAYTDHEAIVYVL